MSTPKFRIARTLWAGLFPLYWLEALDLLPADFEIVDVEEYDQTLELLAAGEIDGNFQSLADLLLMVGRGVDLRLLMASDLSVGVDGVVCRPEIREREGVVREASGAFAAILSPCLDPTRFWQRMG